MKKLFILSLLSALCSMLHANATDADIRAVIDRMFQSMYARDTVTLRACFAPHVCLMTYAPDARGYSRAGFETLDEFVHAVGTMAPAAMEEKLTGWQCLVDDGMASVWTPYEFYYKGNFSHCGVNSFQLMEIGGEWRITMISDTRRKEACRADSETIMEIDSVMNQWHHAAAVADEDAFFGRMTADGIYIGTDATERWLRDELREWSQQYFAQEKAWDFTPLSRNIKLGPGGQVAWLDELLDTWMGTCRSTAILQLLDGEWKLVHYQLSIAVPNDKLDAYRSIIGKS